MSLKFVTRHAKALTNLFSDVGTDSVVCYDVDSFPVSSLSAFYPPAYLNKCTSVTVATSGDNTHQRDWMVICPFRVDESGRHGAEVYDVDPFVVTLDQDSGQPAETGIVAYHQNFPARTSPISGYEHLSREATVATLRQQLVTGSAAVAEASPQVLHALQHMAGVFRSEFS